jgi:asparagine synthase (glutamine-hydrolysing)
VFAGYPVFRSDFLREPDKSFQYMHESDRNRLLSRSEAEIIAYYESIGAQMPSSSDSPPRRMLNSISTPSSMSAFHPVELFTPWTTEAFGQANPEQTIANDVDGRIRTLIKEKWHPMHAALYVWTKGHLANIFLSCLGDRTEMAHSLEARTPFLDHDFTEYVNGLPPSVKLRWISSAGLGDAEGEWKEKYILKEAAKPFITEEIYARQKHVSVYLQSHSLPFHFAIIDC